MGVEVLHMFFPARHVRFNGEPGGIGIFVAAAKGVANVAERTVERSDDIKESGIEADADLILTRFECLTDSKTLVSTANVTNQRAVTKISAQAAFNAPSER